jgi:hypothetical protein
MRGLNFAQHFLPAKFSQFQKRKLAEKTEFFDRPNCARVQGSLLLCGWGYKGGGGRGGGELHWNIWWGISDKGKLHREKDKVELGNKKNYFHLFASSSLCKFAEILLQPYTHNVSR